MNNYYYNPDSKTSRIGGIIAASLYFISLGLLFYFVLFSTEVEEVDEGILIDFGDSEWGQGQEDMATTDTPAQAASKSGEVTPEEYLTDDSSQKELLASQIDNPSQLTTQEDNVTDENQTVEQPREVNQRALFSGRNLSSESSSQGVSDVAEGNQGDESGERDSSSDGTGTGVEGITWNLSGRSVVGRLPAPAYSSQSEGRVVIQIIVDESGKVTSATYIAQGSTTTSSQLVTAARNAALAAQFTPGEEFAQMGTITYIFRRN